MHGLAARDFDLALRGLLGEDAPVSASTVARLKERWHAELAEWRQRPLDDLEVVYMWVDGVYVKAGLERDKAVILVVLAALSDGRKVVVTVVPGYRESTESWSEVLGANGAPEGTRYGVSTSGGWGRSSGYLGCSAQRLPTSG